MRVHARRPSMAEEDTRKRRRRQCQSSWILMFAGYTAVFGGSIVTSLMYVFRAGVAIPEGGDTTTTSAMVGLARNVAIVITVVGLLRFVTLGQWPWKRQRRRLSATDVAVVAGGSGVVLLLVVVGSMAIAQPLHTVNLINYQVGGIPGPPPAVWMQSADAGISEELLVLAVPVTVLRYLRARLWPALVVLVCLRLAYHLYYGWIGVIWLLPWAVGAALVYWRWRSPLLLAVVIVHHAVVDARDLVFGDWGDGVLAAYAGVLIVVACAVRWRWWSTPPSLMASIDPARGNGFIPPPAARGELTVR